MKDGPSEVDVENDEIGFTSQLRIHNRNNNQSGLENKVTIDSNLMN